MIMVVKRWAGSKYYTIIAKAFTVFATGNVTVFLVL
jgi:hypothetical protein